MSSLPGGISVGMALRMLCNSSTREVVCSSSELMDFGRAACNPGVPSVRMEDLMRSWVLFRGRSMVYMAVGVGGANPPVIPIYNDK